MSVYFRSALAPLLLLCSLAVRTVAQVEAHEVKSAPKVVDMKPKTIPKPGATSLIPGKASASGSHPNNLQPLKKPSSFGNNSLEGSQNGKAHLQNAPASHPFTHPDSHLAPGTTTKSGLSPAAKDLSVDQPQLDLKHKKESPEDGTRSESDFPESHKEPELHHHQEGPCVKLTGAAKEDCKMRVKRASGNR